MTVNWTPKRVLMEEGEALIRTAWERLFSSRDQIGEARFFTLDHRLEEIASEWWHMFGIWNDDAYASWKNNLESWLLQNQIPQASALGHVIGYEI